MICPGASENVLKTAIEPLNTVKGLMAVFLYPKWNDIRAGNAGKPQILSTENTFDPGVMEAEERRRSMPKQKVLLEMKGIVKEFPGV
ncbi:MAG: hypothetical protein LUI13_10695 [Lachnospiraceae bacterium]|nr:hypothetical protein [Lachnospiraceae bacterium]